MHMQRLVLNYYDLFFCSLDKIKRKEYQFLIIAHGFKILTGYWQYSVDIQQSIFE